MIISTTAPVGYASRVGVDGMMFPPSLATVVSYEFQAVPHLVDVLPFDTVFHVPPDAARSTSSHEYSHQLFPPTGACDDDEAILAAKTCGTRRS